MFSFTMDVQPGFADEAADFLDKLSGMIRDMNGWTADKVATVKAAVETTTETAAKAAPKKTPKKTAKKPETAVDVTTGDFTDYTEYTEQDCMALLKQRVPAFARGDAKNPAKLTDYFSEHQAKGYSALDIDGMRGLLVMMDANQ